MAPGYNKTSDEITETLLEAVDTVIGARLAQLPYDKTIVCTIVDDSQSGIGKYRVTADNGVNIFNAYASTDEEYFKDTQVYVKIMNNNTSVSRVITGKYTPILDSSIAKSGTNGTFYPFSENESTVLNLRCSNLQPEVNKEVTNLFSGSDSYNGYNGFKITFKYRKERLNKNINARLRVKVSLNGLSSFPLDETDNTAFSSSGDDYLPVNNLLNNDDSAEVSHTLYFYSGPQNIDISSLKITSIFENINIDSNDQTDYAFVITDITVDFGFWIKTLGPNNDFLLILPKKSNGALTSQQYDDDNRKGQVFIYKYFVIETNDNTKIQKAILKDSNYLANIIEPNKIFWGFLDTSYIEKNDIVSDPSNYYDLVNNNKYWHPLKLQSSNKEGKIDKELNTSVEKIKIGLFFSYNRDGWGILKAQDFYLYNSSYTSKTGSLIKGIEGNFSDNTNGNYFIYDKDGNLLDFHEGSAQRTIQLSYNNSTNINDTLLTNEKFVWEFTQGNNDSMIIPLDNDGNSISATNGNLTYDGNSWQSFNYRIKDHYNQNFNNNTIRFTIIHNGTRYQVEKELLFGYSGSEENKYNIVVELTGDRKSIGIGQAPSTSDFDIKVYDYTNNLINRQDYVTTKTLINDNTVLSVEFKKEDSGTTPILLAKTYYPIGFSQYNNNNIDLYIYNGPTTITYDEKGTIKYNKVNCSLKMKDGSEISGNIKWDSVNNAYFSLSQDGKFAPAKICDLNSPQSFVITGRNNNNIIWKQTLWFERNENITATQPGEEETSTSPKIGDTAETISNVSVGRVKNDEDNKIKSGVFVGSVKNSTSENYGLFCYKDAEQLLKIADTGDLKIGVNDTAKYGDKSKPSGATQILQGEWTVTNAAKLTTTSAGADNKFVYFNNGIPVESNATIGSSSKPIYLNNGTLTAITDTVGSVKKPIYLNGGAITVCNATVGSANQPIYSNNGEMTKINQIAIDGTNYDLIPAINKIILALINNVDLKTNRTIWQET